MYNYYSTVDNITVTFNNTREDGEQIVYVRFDRPCEDGLDFAKYKIPQLELVMFNGFCNSELLGLEQYLKSHMTYILNIVEKQ